MIITRINGGLGNQLFQYAVGYALAIKNNDTLSLDMTSFKNQKMDAYTKRNPDILDFLITAPVADDLLINKYRNPYGIISKGHRFFSQKILKNYYSDWHPTIMNKKGNIYLDGYFQSEKYFLWCFDSLKEQFSLPVHSLNNIKNILSDFNNKKNIVSIHVRRGDYIHNKKVSKFHNICNVDYFNDAIIKMENLIGDFNLAVFSDDINWVKNNLTLKSNALFISDQYSLSGNILTSTQELYLMSKCSHHIISNSTFSWWGAYLNCSPNKIVIAPSLWNRSRFDSHLNILPEAWYKIPVH